MFFPNSAQYAEKEVQRAHVTSLHGGVGLSMTKVRETFWVLRLRKLTKRVLRKGWGCKRFQAVAAACPLPRVLPKERTEGNTSQAL